MVETFRKHFVIPVAVVGLSVAFVVICIILAITKDNDAVLRKKLRIGGLILALSGVVSHGTLYATCYEQEIPAPVVEPASEELGTIEMNINETNTLEAVIHYDGYQDFTFALMDGDTVVQWGAVEPADGVMDSDKEPVKITIDPNLVSIDAAYELRVLWGKYEDAAAILATESYDIIDSYELIVRGE